MGWGLIEELLQAKADEEPLRCGDWSEEGCGGNSFQRGPEWKGWLSRCFFDTRIPRRLWWGAGLGSPVFRFGSHLSSLPSPMSLFPVWPLHEPDLSYADPNYGELARPGVWRQNQLPDGQCKIHQQRYFLSFWLISTITSFLSQVLGCFGLFSCQLWASTTL